MMKKAVEKLNDIKGRCDFGYGHYKEILKLLKQQNYRFCFFSEPPDQKVKRLYLRHDIDFSLDKALRMAEIERQKNVRATYFIRLATPLYNVFEPANVRIIKKIIALGHQIGLHFEKPLDDSFQPTKSRLEKEIPFQMKILQMCFKTSKNMSFHRPTKFLFGRGFKNFTSAYSKEFFTDIKYLSDSRGNWREGCVCQWLKSPKPPFNLQVLIHPVWWGRTEKDPDAYLYGCLREKFKHLDKALSDDNPFYKRRFSA